MSDIELAKPEERAAFQVGERWYSYDGGHSWTRQQWSPEVSGDRAMVVTRVDSQTGTITLGVAPKVES
jgi:photosystem II stability/assembly factor-like uncharacterized protein